MVKNEFSIRIAGSGTKEQVIKDLKKIIDAIKMEPPEGLSNGQEFEFPNLMCEVNDSGSY